MTEKLGELYELTFDEEQIIRLDSWLSTKLSLSRSHIKKLIEQDHILVNGVTQKAGYRLQMADKISAIVPKKNLYELEPQNIPIDIVFEDEELAIVNKPKGLVVHPGPGNCKGTLVNALLFHLDNLSSEGEAYRPGIVHRLDKDTSGLMVIAKTNETYRYLTGQFKLRLIHRHYVALVHGAMVEDEGIIEQPIGRHVKDRKKMAIINDGRWAKTEYQVQEKFNKYSLILCKLVTGRMHQIRVHFASIHHPLVGDEIYGFRRNNLGAKSQLLHSCYLAFNHPLGGFVEFISDPDFRFMQIVQKARLIV
ncbi:MAG TPA: RluA family pseudouridine synthase [Natronincola sp.]|nr:RluA family pseudouridine synthase [Natronincola sp.]